MLGGVTCRAGTGLDRHRRRPQQLGLAVDGSEIVRRARRRRADRGRSRRRPLRRRRGRDLAGRLERARAAACCSPRACSARCGARARPSPPSCARSRIGSPRRAAGSTPRPARPISAMRAARSISTDAGLSRQRRGRGARRRRRRFTRRGLDGFADGWFTAGQAHLHARRQCRARGRGEDASRRRRRRAASSCGRRCRSRSRAGDTFTVTAGCDKRFATCRDRFDNAVNFRGFPHIPGNDFVVSYPVAGRARQRRREPERAADDDRRCTRAASRHRRRGARLDRHALSASGLAQGRRLRLPRPGARRVARGLRRRAGAGAGLCAATGRRRRGARRWREAARAAS